MTEAQFNAVGCKDAGTVYCVEQVGSIKAWVNFNGQGTVAIRASGNVSSITDNGTGSYTINFATAMPDTNYTMVASASPLIGTSLIHAYPHYLEYNDTYVAPSTTSCAVSTDGAQNNAGYDVAQVHVAIFR